MMMYVYLRSYEEAVRDFEEAAKSSGYAYIALEARNS